jgi:hypothetical protein
MTLIAAGAVKRKVCLREASTVLAITVGTVSDPVFTLSTGIPARERRQPVFAPPGQPTRSQTNSRSGQKESSSERWQGQLQNRDDFETT